jgi:hypothetical protein
MIRARAIVDPTPATDARVDVVRLAFRRASSRLVMLYQK